MKIYFDTEFTGLHQHTTLISIGLISEDDRVFYAEFTDFDGTQVNDWIRENVIEHLFWKDREKINKKEGKYTFINSTSDEIADALLDWLKSFDEEIQLVSDVCHYDFVLFLDLFGDTALDLPEFISPCCHDINQDLARYLGISDREAFGINRFQFIKDHDLLDPEWEYNQHSSMDDAVTIAIIDNIINRKKENE